MNKKKINSKLIILLLISLLIIIIISVFALNKNDKNIEAIITNKNYASTIVPAKDIKIQIDLNNKLINISKNKEDLFDTRFKLNKFKHNKQENKFEFAILLDYKLQKKGVIISNIKYKKVTDSINKTQTAFLSMEDENRKEVSFGIGIKENEFFLSIPESEIKNSKIITITFHGLNKISYNKYD